MNSKTYHDINVKELDEFTLHQIKQTAHQSFIQGSEVNSTILLFESFMTFLKNNNFKIVNTKDDHSLLTKSKVREVIKEGVHSSVFGYDKEKLVNELMRKLGFLK